MWQDLAYGALGGAAAYFLVKFVIDPFLAKK
jgi:hypothetical protein